MIITDLMMRFIHWHRRSMEYKDRRSWFRKKKTLSGPLPGSPAHSTRVTKRSEEHMNKEIEEEKEEALWGSKAGSGQRL